MINNLDPVKQGLNCFIYFANLYEFQKIEVFIHRTTIINVFVLGCVILYETTSLICMILITQIDYDLCT